MLQNSSARPHGGPGGDGPGMALHGAHPIPAAPQPADVRARVTAPATSGGARAVEASPGPRCRAKCAAGGRASDIPRHRAGLRRGRGSDAGRSGSGASRRRPCAPPTGSSSGSGPRLRRWVSASSQRPRAWSGPARRPSGRGGGGRARGGVEPRGSPRDGARGEEPAACRAASLRSTREHLEVVRVSAAMICRRSPCRGGGRCPLRSPAASPSAPAGWAASSRSSRQSPPGSSWEDRQPSRLVEGQEGPLAPVHGVRRHGHSRGRRARARGSPRGSHPRAPYCRGSGPSSPAGRASAQRGPAAADGGTQAPRERPRAAGPWPRTGGGAVGRIPCGDPNGARHGPF